MKIKHIARIGEELLDKNLDPILENTLDDTELDEIIEEFDPEVEVEVDPEFIDTKEPSLENIEMVYVDPDTGLNKPSNSLDQLVANDGMEMLSGTIKIDGIDLDNLSDKAYKQALTDTLLDFINSDIRINITEDSLITNDLDVGVVSFLVSPAFRLSSSKQTLIRTAIRDAKEIQRKVNKAYLSFMKSMGDLDTVDINRANNELFELVEKVSYLDNLEKIKLRTKIREEFKNHGITLTYIEINR